MHRAHHTLKCVRLSNREQVRWVRRDRGRGREEGEGQRGEGRDKEGEGQRRGGQRGGGQRGGGQRKEGARRGTSFHASAVSQCELGSHTFVLPLLHGLRDVTNVLDSSLSHLC